MCRCVYINTATVSLKAIDRSIDANTCIDRPLIEHGQFILRIDDTDQLRCRTEYIQAIQDDLHWLGISWHTLFQQSQRADLYAQYFTHLHESGRIYPCFETSAQLEAQRTDQLATKMPPIYDRTKGQALQTHEKPYWRFAPSPTGRFPFRQRANP
jgi:glutamyl-tRNA synthetase